MIRLALCCDAARVDDLSRCASRLEGARHLATCNSETLSATLRQHAESVDAVLLYTEPSARAEECETVRKAGKHLFIEAPIALEPVTAARVHETCRASGRSCWVEQPARCLPSLVEVSSCLASGVLGDPMLARIHRWQSTPAELDREIDLACWWLARWPERVWAVGDSKTSGSVLVHLAFERGGMALIDLSARLTEDESYYSATVIGTRGAAHADDHRNVQLLYAGAAPRALVTSDRGLENAATTRRWQQFVDGIVAGSTGTATVEAALRVLAIAEAVQASIDSERPATWTGGRYELV